LVASLEVQEELVVHPYQVALVASLEVREEQEVHPYSAA